LRTAFGAILATWMLGAGLAPHALAKVFLGADEAAHLAFADAEVERTVAYLTAAEIARVRELAGTDVESAVVTRFRARAHGQDAGIAYVDTHRVRTLTETLLIVLDPKGAIRRVEVLSFNEPEEYLPRAAWFGQFEGRELDAELSLKAKIRPVAGATLTARAVTDASRRVLAIHRVLSARAAR
jgi:hypothetical protein